MSDVKALNVLNGPTTPATVLVETVEHPQRSWKTCCWTKNLDHYPLAVLLADDAAASAVVVR